MLFLRSKFLRATVLFSLAGCFPPIMNTPGDASGTDSSVQTMAEASVDVPIVEDTANPPDATTETDVVAVDEGTDAMSSGPEVFQAEASLPEASTDVRVDAASDTTTAPMDSAPTTCRSSADCGSGMTCSLGACGSTGMCIVMPRCTLILSPVCGCNGVTYSNDCLRINAGIALRSTGACPSDAGTDGAASDAPTTCTVGTGCCATNADCASGSYCVNIGCNAGRATGVCKTPPGTGCWRNGDCPRGTTCQGANICECGVRCIVRDSPGTCMAL